jgi:uncharacterized integral membrane protein
MSILHRNGSAPPDPAATAPPRTVAEPPAATPDRSTGRTRISAAWLGICLAAAVLVVLIVFMAQNTGSVEITFLWMHGSLPLAIALLIAGVGAALLTMMVGAARITQLRHRFRRATDRARPATIGRFHSRPRRGAARRRSTPVAGGKDLP